MSLLWGFPIDGLKFAKLHLVDVKLPSAVAKLSAAIMKYGTCQYVNMLPQIT